MKARLVASPFETRANCALLRVKVKHIDMTGEKKRHDSAPGENQARFVQVA